MTDEKDKLLSAASAAKMAIAGTTAPGNAAEEFLRLVLVPPMGKRRDEWLQSMYDRLKELERHMAGFRVEALVTNEAFISAVLQASQAAIRTHERQKLEALRMPLSMSLRDAVRTPTPLPSSSRSSMH